MTTNTTQDRFEDRLLAQLRAVVAENPEPPTPAPAQARSRAPRLALATAGTAAAAVAVALVATGGGDGSTAKAYDVQAGDGGDVSVTIRSLDDASGLQQSLRAAGVPAVVCKGTLSTPAPTAHRTRGAEAGTDAAAEGGDDGPSVVRGGADGAGKRTAPAPTAPPADGAAATGQSVPSAAGVPADATTLAVRAGDDGAATFTVHRGDVPSGERLYITTAGGGDRAQVAVGIGSGAGC